MGGKKTDIIAVTATTIRAELPHLLLFPPKLGFSLRIFLFKAALQAVTARPVHGPLTGRGLPTRDIASELVSNADSQALAQISGSRISICLHLQAVRSALEAEEHTLPRRALEMCLGRH